MRGLLSRTNVNRPKGQLADGLKSREIRTNDQLFKAAEYRDLVVAFRNGAPVRLADLGEVVDSLEDVRTEGLLNGKTAVMVVIFRSPGANIIETVDRIRALLPQLSAAIPQDINISVTVDRSPPIRRSLEGRGTHPADLGQPGNSRGVRLPAECAGHPHSSGGRAGVPHQHLRGYVSAELQPGQPLPHGPHHRHGFCGGRRHCGDREYYPLHRKGRTSMASRALGSPRDLLHRYFYESVVGGGLHSLLLMGGMVGRLFREFAVVLSVAILISLAVSLTTTPMMCAALLRSEKGQAHGRLFRASEWIFEWLRHTYDRSLRWASGRPRFMVSLTVVTLAVNIGLFLFIPKGFFPEQDIGRITGRIQAAQDISYQAMREKIKEVSDIIRTDPDVTDVLGFTGGGGGGGSTTNTGRMFVALKPFGERRTSAREIMARLRQRLAQVPGAPTYLQAVQDLRIGGMASGALYQFTLRGDNLEELNTWGPQVTQKLRSLPQLVDVNSDQQNKGLQASLVIDRDTASRFGITAQLFDDTLYDAFGQRQVSITYTSLNQYHVVMEVAPPYWQRPETLRDIYVHSPRGGEVPLSAITRFAPTTTPLAVNHLGQFPAVTTSFNLAPGAALGDAVAAIESATKQLGMPASIRGTFLGTAEAFKTSLASEPYLILAALLAVYIVLGILYESYVHPITILSTLPSAGVGALVALLVSGTELSLIAVIGIILLIGIVKKNGIMMVDFALEVERKEGKPPEEAIYEACLLRFRPIMMTTMAALLGALPLALGHGVGSELRRPLGISIVGGLIFSQMLTLYTTPVIYLYLDRFRLWVNRWRGKATALVNGRTSLASPPGEA